MSEVGGALTIAQRDLTKLLRDRVRMATDVVFPLVLVLLLGGTLQMSFGSAIGYDFLVFVFTGVFAQTLWQSAAMGMIFLVEDRENDFSQEIFVSPISRFTIVFGKILGESLVALPQGLAIVLLVVLLGVPLSLAQIAGLAWATAVVCLFGGSFGLVVLAGLRSRRAANQVFTFIMLPQFFLAGVFTPLENAPPFFDAVSRLAPMRYGVDLVRSVFYAGRPEYGRVVLDGAAFDLAVIAGLFALFMLFGTFLFVRAERNR